MLACAALLCSALHRSSLVGVFVFVLFWLICCLLIGACWAWLCCVGCGLTGLDGFCLGWLFVDPRLFTTFRFVHHVLMCLCLIHLRCFVLFFCVLFRALICCASLISVCIDLCSLSDFVLPRFVLFISFWVLVSVRLMSHFHADSCSAWVFTDLFGNL